MTTGRRPRPRAEASAPLPHTLRVKPPSGSSDGGTASLVLDDGPSLLPPPDRHRHVHLVLDGDSLGWSDVVDVLEADSVTVTLSPSSRELMARCRAGALRRIVRGERVYGWNQGLGPLKDRALSPDEQYAFQVNVLRSHAAGVGENLSPPIARLALVLRANVLARATSGVRPEVVDRILDVVNAGITPLMPEIGSLGTGDLQPMAAAGLMLIGEPVAVSDRGEAAWAGDALRRAGLDGSFALDQGEALALISGSSVLCACFAAAVRRVEYQADTFLGAFALFCEATRAEPQAFDQRLHAERRLPQEAVAAGRIRDLVATSGWMTPAGRLRLGEAAPRVQDSTSVRSTPHKVAGLLRMVDEAKRLLSWEANASTSNPLVLSCPDGGYEFVMGGNWDCTVLGHSAHDLNVGATDLAVLAKDLSSRLSSELWSYGLPASLSGGKVGLHSGMTLVQAVGASLVPEMHVRSTPVNSLSFPLKGGQEDHNTMAMASLRNLVSNLERFDIVLAVLLLMGAQGMDLIAERMAELEPGPGSRRVHDLVRSEIAPLGDDRYMTDDVDRATALVRHGRVGAVVRMVREQAGAPGPLGRRIPVVEAR